MPQYRHVTKTSYSNKQAGNENRVPDENNKFQHVEGW